ncbi:MAG: hypothetical protein QXE01_03755 [Sulfolobales archaeon]
MSLGGDSRVSEGSRESYNVDKALQLLRSRPKVIGIGLEHFSRELKRQGVRVIHVNWQPRPRLEKDLEDILSKIL